MIEEIQITVDGIFDPRHHFRREADGFHLCKAPAHQVIFQKIGPVRSGQKQKHSLKAHAKSGNRHIGATDKTVPRADNCPHRRGLAVGTEKEVYARRQRRPEKRQQEHVADHEKDVGDA